MDKYHADIIQTLSILITLQRGKDYLDAVSKLTKDAPDTSLDPLFIKRQHLHDAGLTVFDFALSLAELGKKGYVLGFTFFDKDLQDKMYRDLEEKPDECEKISEALGEVTPAIGDKIIQDILPQHLQHEFKELDDVEEEPTTFVDLQNFATKFTSDMFSYAWLMPFRDYQSLWEQLKRGVDFNDIEEFGFSYNKETGMLYINETRVQLNMHGDKSNIHYIILYMIKHGLRNQHYFAEMNTKEILGEDKIKRTYQDAVLNLQKRIKKENPKYDDVFIVTTKEVQLNPKYLPTLKG